MVNVAFLERFEVSDVYRHWCFWGFKLLLLLCSLKEKLLKEKHSNFLKLNGQLLPFFCATLGGPLWALKRNIFPTLCRFLMRLLVVMIFIQGLPRVKNVAVTSTSEGLELNYHFFNVPFDLNFKTIAFSFLSCISVAILSLILLDISLIITICFFSLSDQISQVHIGYQEVKSCTQVFFTTKITILCLNNSISLPVHTSFCFRRENLDWTVVTLE